MEQSVEKATKVMRLGGIKKIIAKMIVTSTGGNPLVSHQQDISRTTNLGRNFLHGIRAESKLEEMEWAKQRCEQWSLVEEKKLIS